jgi:peptidoglycan/LPS O-acetylase OafA/YrhL
VPLRSRSYAGIDAIRLLAALLVAAYHLGFWLWLPPRGQFAFHNELAPLAPFVSYGWVGVEVFFVISGFAIAFSASLKDAQEFVIGRALRLYPAAWICASITFLFAGNWPAYLRSVTLSPIGPWVSGLYWTLAIEIVFYALVAVALWRGWTMVRVALGLGAWSSAFWLLKAANGTIGLGIPFEAIESNAGYLLLLHYGVYFALGMLLYLKRHLAVAAGFAFVAFAAVAWRSHAMALNGDPFYVAALVWAACSLAVAWCAFRNPALRFLPARTLGLITYPLYLVHVELGSAVMLACAPLGAWPALAIGMASILLVARAVLPVESAIRRGLVNMATVRVGAEPASLP